MTKETNPYFKYGKEDLRPTCKRTIGLKLPKSLFCSVEECDKETCDDCKNGKFKENIVNSDFFKHFSGKDKSLINMSNVTLLNNQEILETLIINYMNSQCLERKYFDIDVVAIFHNKFGYYWDSRDDYYINRNNLVDEFELYEREDPENYLDSSNVMSLEDLALFQTNHFTDKGFKYIDGVYEEFELEILENYENLSNAKFLTMAVQGLLKDYGVYFENLTDYNYDIVLFRVNNYLDNWRDGVYKYNVDKDREIHLGIGKYSTFTDKFTKDKGNLQEEKIHYFIYKWYFDDDFNIKFDDYSIKEINKDYLKDLITNSDNDELKTYFNKDIIKGLDDKSSLEIENENLKFKNKELVKDIENLNKDFEKMKVERDYYKKYYNNVSNILQKFNFE